MEYQNINNSKRVTMQKYIIIAFVITAMLGYIGWLKYDNIKLQTTISSLESKNKGLETSLNIQINLNKIQDQKNQELVNNIKELENKPVKIETKYVTVKDCRVQISKVDTNITTAKGIPLFLGNIGKTQISSQIK